MKLVIILLLGIACKSSADRDDLTKFGNRVYELMTSANIFDKVYSLPTDPKDTEKFFYDVNLQLLQHEGLTDYVTLQRISAAAKDYFNGKFTADKNFKAEMHLVRFYLNYKGLLTDENTDFYAQKYFLSQKAAVEAVESSGQYENPYITLTKGDINFFDSFRIPADETRLTMVYYADEMENIRYS